ncbi:hypothetical protein B7463_g7286, partial [Scytalidium lignicola]
METPLPTLNSPAAQAGLVTFSEKSHDDIFGLDGSIKGHSAIVHPDRMEEREAYAYNPRPINNSSGLPSGTPKEEPTTTTTTQHVAQDTQEKGENTNMASEELPQKHPQEQKQLPGFPKAEKVAENLKATVTTVDVEHADHHKGTEDIGIPDKEKDAQNDHSATGTGESNGLNTGPGEQGLPSRDKFPTSSLPEHTTDDPHYDENIAGEVARVQGVVSSKQGETQMEAVTRHLNHTKNIGFKVNAPECSPKEEMTPYIPHPIHGLFPIAMVCREPYGIPTHGSVYNPQNEAWLSALRNAKKNVFIQSPTLNAEPLVPAIIEACERGVDVYCYITLGYNDAGELLPMQGGTNEMVAHKMYTTLSQAGKQHLHYFFYVAKDQTAPIVAKKKRSCHNTCIYGDVNKEDGAWRDENGNQAPDTIGVDPGRFSWAKGVMGAVKRVQGTGDF